MKYLNLKRFYYAVGKSKFFEFIVFSVFLLFFYGPLLNLVLLAFANRYETPAVIPQEIGIKWWNFVLQQKNLVSSIGLSFLIAAITTAVSLIICVPAAYAFARFEFKGRKLFLFSFLFSNAFPKMGLYIAIGIIFYKFNLIGTLPGVVIIHMLNTMMFMTWIPSSAFRTIHRQQEEAARDVGAGPVRTFLSVTFPLALPGITVASIFTFLYSLEEAQGTMVVGLPTFRTMPIEMYGVILDFPATAGAVFAIILIIPTIVLLFLLRKFIGPEALSKGFKMK